MKKLKIAVIVVACLVVVAVGGFGFIYSGLYNVSAIPPDDPVTTWVASTTLDHSVARHARGIEPPALCDARLLSEGQGLYVADCASCHGDATQPPSGVGKGLRPSPPLLRETAKDWTPAELYWIVKNGIRMTGMPAWGGSYSDQDLWRVVAYTAQLPDLAAKSAPRASKPSH